MNQKQSIQIEIDSILEDYLSRVRSVGVEEVSLQDACGRFLSDPVVSFRPSPPVDVSAMDGYALRMSDLREEDIPVFNTLAAGMQPTVIKHGQATKIFTGAAVPEGADLVIRREDCLELPSSQDASQIRIRIPLAELQRGQNIRLRGENAMAGDLVLPARCSLGPQAIAGIATFQQSKEVLVFRKLRVGVINTGDEIFPAGVPIESWQIRDSNGPFLLAALKRVGWADPVVIRVPDSLAQIRSALSRLMESCDAILLTGGVSMGDSDHVPEAIRQAGGEVLFHRLPIRPGKPLLGAIADGGKPILGLPGNPVSVAVTFRRFAYPILKQAAGGTPTLDALSLPIQTDNEKTLPLVWFRLVTKSDNGTIALEQSKGSGDIASLTHSAGFIEVPPGETTSGIRSFYSWL